MNFVPTKQCNPQLSRRIGDVVGYIPHQYYFEVIDAIFSGTVETWSDLPSNVQDIILKSETEKRVNMQIYDEEKKQTIQRIDAIKKQLDDIKNQLKTEKELVSIQNNTRIKQMKKNIFGLHNIQRVNYE